MRRQPVFPRPFPASCSRVSRSSRSLLGCFTHGTQAGGPLFSVSRVCVRSRWAPTSNRCRQRRCHFVTLLRCDESASSAVISSSWQIASSTRSTGGSAASMSSRRVCSLSRSLASGALPACTRSFSRKMKSIASLLWRRAAVAGLNPRLAMLAIIARAAAASRAQAHSAGRSAISAVTVAIPAIMVITAPTWWAWSKNRSRWRW